MTTGVCIILRHIRELIKGTKYSLISIMIYTSMKLLYFKIEDVLRGVKMYKICGF